MSPMHREADGKREIFPTWESLVEKKIREAMAAGDFDDLPYQGEHVPIDDDGSEWALAHHILKQAGVAPGWILADKEIRSLLDERDRLVARVRGRPADGAGPAGASERDRAEMARIVDRVNALVLRLEHDAPTPRQHRPRLDLEKELALLQDG
ncbi:MAG TPA: DUF1992 domain-containing protein [Candidatus Limnocylindrales bacterium]